MKPAMLSPAARPRWACTAGSNAIHAVSHWAPKPSACAACSRAKQPQPAVLSCSCSGTFGSGRGLATTTITSGAWLKRWRSFSNTASPACGSRWRLRLPRKSPRVCRASPALFRTRNGTRLPWSGTRTAEASIRCRVAGSGPGSPSCREGTERRASRASRAAGSGMESVAVITGV
ncbi:hypothetical protein G6F60_013980 [Rhizopus arrhizus]|nr:hypothetical protein G6F60_013980 [Rhizopus arrhizus]